MKARSVTVEQHVEFIDALYEYASLSKMRLKRSEFEGCAGYVPIILYCRKKVRKKTDVRDQKVSARGTAAEFVKKNMAILFRNYWRWAILAPFTGQGLSIAGQRGAANLNGHWLAPCLPN